MLNHEVSCLKMLKMLENTKDAVPKKKLKYDVVGVKSKKQTQLN